MSIIQKALTAIRHFVSYNISRIQRKDKNQTKIFCIGRNKTGTTSLAVFFKINGYKVGNQKQAEQLMEDWAKRDFTRIIEYCQSAEVFQDLPFSLPETYKALDKAYPKSKFILTIRSTPEEWFNSLVAHHSKQMSSTPAPPTEDDLRMYKYRRKYKGFILSVQKAVYGVNTPLYDKTAYIAHYERHNADIIEYFKDRPNDLIIINLRDDAAFQKLCDFLEIDSKYAQAIPHENRSADMKKRLPR